MDYYQPPYREEDERFYNLPGFQGGSGQSIPGQPSDGSGFPGGDFPGQPGGSPGVPSEGFSGQSSGDPRFPGGGFPGQPGGGPGFPGGGFPGQPGGGPGFPGGGFPGQPSGGPGFPSGGFPGGPGGQFPGQPDGPGGFPGGQQSGGAPTTPPPNFTPQQSQFQTFAVDPGAIRGCLFRFTYIWLRRDAFWFYPTFVGRTSIAGFRWNGFRWVFFGIDLNQIQSFQCF
ncbi:hypothetical protein [Oceanobacillus arenosus]|uniref:hypothetical protein n=1 Tax=Oceanobacillus arenosus TaxID=1229153 RepID=UPI002699B4A1